MSTGRNTKTRCILQIALLFATSSAITHAKPWVDPEIDKNFRLAPTQTLLIDFDSPNEKQFLKNYTRLFSIQERFRDAEILPNFLQKQVDESQKSAVELLIKKNPTSRYFQAWVTNTLIAHDVDAKLFQSILNLPNIKRIRADHKSQVIEPIPDTDVKFWPNFEREIIEEGQFDLQWGIRDVGAPEIWAAGNKGAGVVVGFIDTGVSASHILLKNNWRQDFGWYDAINNKPEPYDDHVHGTHVVAIAVGSQGYGVAPDAEWISCKGYAGDGTTSSSARTQCFDYFFCPFKNGIRDCTKRPQIISNSWGNPINEYEHYLPMEETIEKCIAQGQVIIFAAGNEGYYGNGCKTIREQGSIERVITVGMMNSNYTVNSNSSRGPTILGHIKPDMVAPGVDIMSAAPSAKNHVRRSKGSSMATPHVI